MAGGLLVSTSQNMYSESNMPPFTETTDCLISQFPRMVADVQHQDHSSRSFNSFLSTSAELEIRRPILAHSSPGLYQHPHESSAGLSIMIEFPLQCNRRSLCHSFVPTCFFSPPSELPTFSISIDQISIDQISLDFQLFS